jgi:hypothetical protein
MQQRVSLSRVKTGGYRDGVSIFFVCIITVRKNGSGEFHADDRSWSRTATSLGGVESQRARGRSDRNRLRRKARCAH